MSDFISSSDVTRISDRDEPVVEEAVVEEPVVEEAPAPEPKPKKKTRKTKTTVAKKESKPAEVLVRMTRPQVKFSSRGYTFTKKHPFQVVAAEDADYFLEMEGFEQATPSQAESYYNG